MNDQKPVSGHAEFEQLVAEILRNGSIPFKKQVCVGGVQPDFLIETPDGRSIIIELKSCPPTEGDIGRAIHQVQLYKHAIGADEAVLVLKGLKRSRPAEGVVSENELIDLISAIVQHTDPSGRGDVKPDIRARSSETFSFGKVPRGNGFKPPLVQSEIASTRAIFAAMPFSGEYDDTYLVAMAHAADSIGAVCRRVDREDFAGDIVDEIQKLIRNCVAVIADLSESKPNVLYETGFAHGLGLPTIHICSTPLDQLPFDIRNWNTIHYVKGQTYSLRDVLAKRMASLLKGVPPMK